jgi:ATP-binding cassette subfamily B protein
MPRSNKQPDHDTRALAEALWPSARVGDAVRALARHAGSSAAGAESSEPTGDLGAEELSSWIVAAADQLGMQADRVFVALHELQATISTTPALLKVRTIGGSGFGFLALLGRRRGSASVVGPDLRVRRIRLDAICAAIRRPFEEPLEPAVDHLLDRTGMTAGARNRAREAMLSEQLAATRVGGYWELRSPPTGGLREAAREAGLIRGTVVLAFAYLAHSVLLVLSWWLLGRGLLNGTIDEGWLLGWALLLVSLVPFRLVTSWTQGLVAISAGATLRRRLLRGALRIDPQHVRQNGAGRFFGLVAEASAVESLALTGGLTAFLALLELGVSAVVLWLGLGVFPVVMLLSWLGFTAWLAHRYWSGRRQWTRERLSMTHQLLESMVGHRTRLAQEPLKQRHAAEDDALDRYLRAGLTMDGWDLGLTTIVSRGWMVLAIAAIVPAAAAGVSAGRLAVGLGGMLLAFRALRRLTAGLADLAGAAIAGHLVAPLIQAGSRRDTVTSPSVAIPSQLLESVDATAAQARDLVFRYRPEASPVLHGCSLRVPRGARLLVEGPSGSGKTTFASILAGLQVPESGLMLVDGLDRSVLGSAGWRSRVGMAPQPGSNYLVSGSLAFNLLMGRGWPAEDRDLIEAEEVCRELGLADLLDRMPCGLHQIVGETGWQLSQGERTRIFLARALLQRSKLLVLDESFSGLDPENVDRAVRCVTGRAQTVLAIAHA